ncbi:MAG: LysM peptidoglycan-binding domain-containing protein [Gammaproteobacteria bacterium]|nr:LysM peptidoglycan-binding domain-containing protein [Gammaproteobacteria bacterium]
MRTLLLTGYLLFAGLLPFSVQAEELALTENPPELYIVKEGDTLWQISSLYLRDPWKWPEIWDVNPQLDNPHLIFPGDRLYLVYVDGQPRLRVRRGAGSRTVKLTPQMRIEPLDAAISAISLERIGAWLSAHRVVSPEQLANAPYVIAGAQRHLLSAAGDLFYARGIFPEEEVGYGVFRTGETYVDPLTEEVLGHQAVDIGNATLLERHEDELVHLEVTRVTEEVRNGDRLLPNEARKISATFYPRAPEQEVRAFMIAVDGGVTQIGTMDVVAINRGEREGFEPGYVLAIYQTGEVVRDPVVGGKIRMPDARAGLMMIFRTFEKVSYGIVLKANRPLSIMDKVTNP